MSLIDRHLLALALTRPSLMFDCIRARNVLAASDSGSYATSIAPTPVFTLADESFSRRR